MLRSCDAHKIALAAIEPHFTSTIVTPKACEGDVMIRFEMFIQLTVRRRGRDENRDALR